MKHRVEEVHISNIRPGDTVMHEGKMRTVCVKDIKTGGFMGTSLFGDSYHSGYKLVERVIIERAIPEVKV